MNWKNIAQELIDSEGNSPTQPQGTRVIFRPDRDNSKYGTVLHQRLHYDWGESFFGNVIVEMDDGRLIEGHCWQFKKVEGK